MQGNRVSVALSDALQRGRACEGAEMANHHQSSHPDRCFNGAAPVRARKFPVTEWQEVLP